MWDNPRQLNALAGFLVGLTGLAITLTGMQLLLHSGLWPLREVSVRGELKHTTRAEIEAALQGRVAGNFFDVGLSEVRLALEQLPWVRRVSVRRVWPDWLELSLEEHVALGRWSDGALINTFGERFAGRSDAPLPEFVAPAGTEGEVAKRYARFAQTLAPLGARLEQVVLTPRLAWQLRLSNGLHLVLGRDADAAQARLERFAAVFAATLGKTGRRYDYVDLRYPNGFALRVPELKG